MWPPDVFRPVTRIRADTQVPPLRLQMCFVRRLFLFIFIAWMTFTPSVFPHDEETVEGERSEYGFIVGKGSYVAIPGDMEMKRVAKNVIKPEPDAEYVSRKLDLLEKTLGEQLATLDTRWEERFKKIEEQLTRIEKNTRKKQNAAVF